MVRVGIGHAILTIGATSWATVTSLESLELFPAAGDTCSTLSLHVP